MRSASVVVSVANDNRKKQLLLDMLALMTVIQIIYHISVSSRFIFAVVNEW
jgi:hypothetical protein